MFPWASHLQNPGGLWVVHHWHNSHTIFHYLNKFLYISCFPSLGMKFEIEKCHLGSLKETAIGINMSIVKWEDIVFKMVH